MNTAKKRNGHSLRRILKRAASASALTWGLLAQSQTMTVPGQFGVSPEGAATYTIPIQVPPGVAGMEPRLALAFNSHGGNGTLGVGWNLAGLSSVARCPRTMAQDGVRGSVNLNASDRFCMDGQRLVLVSGEYGAAGSEYRTEIEGFARITYNGSGFVVENKAGLRNEYGQTSNSRVLQQGKTVPSLWMLNKTSDTVGNYMTFTYIQNVANSDFRLERVDYTGYQGSTSGSTPTAERAPNNSVRLTYGGRNDTSVKYARGSKTKVLSRLNAVSTYVGNNLVQKYALGYETSPTAEQPSTVVAIKVLDAAGQALPLTSFSYSGTDQPQWDQRNFSQNNVSVAQTETAGTSVGCGIDELGYYSCWEDTSPKTVGSWLLDINGDGVVDLVTLNAVGEMQWNLGTGTGGEQGEQWGATRSQTTGMCIPTNKDRQWWVDINGDGLPDYVTMNPTRYDLCWNLSLGTGESGTQMGGSQLQGILPSMEEASDHWFVDINGDGLPDYVFKTKDGRLGWHLNLGPDGAGNRWGDRRTLSGLDAGGSSEGKRWLLDINGDGMPDYVYIAKTGVIRWRLNQGTGQSDTQWGPQQTQAGFTFGALENWLVDINGDGLPDFVAKHNDSNLYWHLNQGTGVTDVQWGQMQNQSGLSNGAVGSWFVDLNGDGLPDYVTKTNNRSLQWYLNKGTGNSGTQWDAGHSQDGLHGVAANVWFEDINADGYPDYVIKNNDGTIYWNLMGTKKRMLSQIDTGDGVVRDITYSRLPKRRLSATYPVLSLPTTGPVVTQVATSNGAGGKNTVQYDYDGLRMELGTGRGILGFGVLRTKELATGLEVTTTLRQDWPYVGLATNTETRLDGLLLKRSTNSYECKTGDGQSCPALPLNCNSAASVNACMRVSAGRVFPFVATSQEQSWDLDGTEMPVLTTKTAYERGADTLFWGDVSTMIVTSQDGLNKSEKTVVNEYAPANTASGKWIAGRLRRSTATNTLVQPGTN